ncbi:MAG: winged helix-turn-helix transcriptional regulator, partial [Thermoplasmata archaeon]|nr:winged helix-turn-helix transcriptional regulator [Thermoplasmata archaeon]
GRRYTLLKFLVVPLYSTLSRDRLMENKNRRNIIAIINAREGITFTSLMKELGLKNGALAYHLHTLERGRFIKSVKDGKYRRFYPRGARITGLSSVEEKIIEVIRANPSIGQREIARLIGFTPQTVNYNVKKLIGRGVLYLKKEGKHTRCRLTNPETGAP